MAKYIALIHKELNSDFGVSFIEFPGCITAGSDLDEAEAMAIEALSGHIDILRADGVSIPAPLSLGDVLAHPDAQGAATMVIDVPTDRTIRFNVTAPESQLALIDAAARARGLTRSGFLVAAAAEVTRDQVR